MVEAEARADWPCFTFKKPTISFVPAFAWSRELTGVKELPARWKRCVAAVDSDLGEEVGKLYVAQRFTPATKAKTLELVNAVARAFEKNVNELTWMTPETKKKALAKLRLVSNKIGYPDQWRDYSALQIRRDDAFGNNERSNRFERARRMKKRRFLRR